MIATIFVLILLNLGMFLVSQDLVCFTDSFSRLQQEVIDHLRGILLCYSNHFVLGSQMGDQGLQPCQPWLPKIDRNLIVKIDEAREHLLVHTPVRLLQCRGANTSPGRCVRIALNSKSVIHIRMVRGCSISEAEDIN
jgi:hypothetical protein